MNKGIVSVILLVIVGAMGLIMYSHMGAKQNVASSTPASTSAPRQTSSNPLAAPQGDPGRIRSFEPPLSTASSGESEASGYAPSVTAAPQGTGGAKPVVVSSSSPEGATWQEPSRSASAAPISDNYPDQEPVGPSTKPQQTQKVEQAQKPKPTAKPETTKPETVAAEAPKPEAAKPAETKPQSAAPVRQATPKPSAASSAPGLTPWPGSDSAAEAKPTPTPKPAAQNAAQAKAPEGTRTLRGISLSSSGNLRVEADAPFNYKSFALSQPDRVVIDLPGSWRGMKLPATQQGGPVKKIRIGQNASGYRIVLDLEGPVGGHRVSRSGNAIQVQLQ